MRMDVEAIDQLLANYIGGVSLLPGAGTSAVIRDSRRGRTYTLFLRENP